MQTILVTGGAGFIGSALVRRLLSEQHFNVVVLDKLTYAGHQASLENLEHPDLFEFVQGDIQDAKLVSEIFNQHQPQAIMNLAAESHVDRSIDAPAEFIQTNVLGTTTLLEAASSYYGSLASEKAAAFRFLQVSTDEVYGSLTGHNKFNEDSRYQPNSPYAASKAAADHFVRAYFQTYGLPTIISHSSNNYGPRQLPEKLIPLILLNAVCNKALPVYGDGQQIRDWIHVDDHAAALVLLLKQGKPGETYDIGGDCEKTNLEVIQAVCQAISECLPKRELENLLALITHVKDRPGHDRRYAIDSSKIKNELAWSAKISFESGIKETVAWYLANQDWLHQVWPENLRDNKPQWLE